MEISRTLEKMHWYHTQEFIELQTPSRNEGIDFETEARYRKEGARFIMELGNKLGLYLFIFKYQMCYSDLFAINNL